MAHSIQTGMHSQDEASQLGKYFPNFVAVLRDYTLSKKMGGVKVSERMQSVFSLHRSLQGNALAIMIDQAQPLKMGILVIEKKLTTKMCSHQG